MDVTSNTQHDSLEFFETLMGYKSKAPISVSSLMWNFAYGQYSFDPLNMNCGCLRQNTARKNNNKGMYYQLWVMLEAPALLVVNTDRMSLDGGGKVRTPIKVDEQLNLKKCAKKLALEDTYHYELAAVVNHYSRGAHQGHYTATIFSESEIITYDDERLNRRNKSILNEKEFMTSTHMLFYIRVVHQETTIPQH